MICDILMKQDLTTVAKKFLSELVLCIPSTHTENLTEVERKIYATSLVPLFDSMHNFLALILCIIMRKANSFG